MTPIDIAAACSAATPGPWRDSSGKGSGSVSAAAAKCAIYINVRRHEDEYSDETVARWQADAAFIALARSALPEALDEIQRLRALVEEACESLRLDGDRARWRMASKLENALDEAAAAKGTP